jgi:hypothetical protein
MTTISNIFNEEFKLSIIRTLKGALIEVDQIYKSHSISKKNAVSFLVGDIINRNLQNEFKNSVININEFNRGGWIGEIIDDFDTKTSCSVLRTQRLSALRSEHRDNPHYVDVMLNILNKDIEVTTKQMCMFDDSPSYGEENLRFHFQQITGDSPDSRKGFVYFIVAYNSIGSVLTSANILLFDKNFQEVENLSLDKYIKPDFVTLSSPQANEENNNEPESKSSGMLLKPKQSKTNTSNSPIILSDQEKQA